MPTYTWACQKCGTLRDDWKPLDKREEPVSPCDLCGNQMIRTISSGGFSLRGTGWHNQEYSKTGPKERKR